MAIPSFLAPTRKDKVIDLVRAAGLDVSDWSNSKRGERGAGANPKYCYEWAFIQPEGIVLNLWYEEMRDDDGVVVRCGNFREDATRNRLGGGKPAWVKRATLMDNAIQQAHAQQASLRVIVNDGVRRKQGDPTASRSKVLRRQLDPEPWHVAEYDANTGDHVIARGLGTPRFVDQFVIRPAEYPEPQMRERTSLAFVRARALRNVALARAGGRCEYCRAPGFRMPDRSVYLETHHIVPLAEGGPDAEDNIIALCPNHHREAHHGQGRGELRTQFQALLAAANGSQGRQTA